MSLARHKLFGLLIASSFASIVCAQAPEDTARPHPASAESSSPAQEQSAPAVNETPPPGFKRMETAPPGSHIVQPGTRVLLNMINSVSTRQAAPGDRIYLETAFPIVADGKVIIPQGSWVQGTITQVKRPGKVKGRGQLYIRFDTLTLPNGTMRDFRARVGAMDGRSTEEINREEGKIKAQGNKAGDVSTVADTTITGTGIGALAGVAGGNMGMGAGIGALAGAGAGLASVLLSRGPDAMLAKGTTMEMVLDRPLTFSDSELDFSHVTPRAALSEGSGPQQPSQNARPRRGWSPWPF